MNYKSLEIVRTPHVAAVWLNRPDVRNAFNDKMIAELTHAFHLLGNDVTVRAIVLAARGNVFCAGGDLNWMKKMAGYSQEENLADAKQLAEMLHTIYSCPKPVIARVQGDCYGGGVGLVAASDMAVAAEGVRFSLSEVKLGLIPAAVSPYVIKAMGERAAHRYFLTAERFSAHEAYRIGFIHEMTHLSSIDAKIDGIVNALIAAGPNALASAKRLIAEVSEKLLDQALINDTAQRIAEIRASSEGREGVNAFLDKRMPEWLR